MGAVGRYRAAHGGLVGDCAARVVYDQPATAEIGVTFSRDRPGYGLATEALIAVITKLFQEHALHRVYAQADDRNHAVRRLLERLGFRCEARLIDADWFNCSGRPYVSSLFSAASGSRHNARWLSLYETKSHVTADKARLSYSEDRLPSPAQGLYSATRLVFPSVTW